ncbi:hypothetical protein RHGRI_003899 [Rhododendron griersonianum]|uniref:Uncharacterized protein n=1 Tax=Rhododendron griersonianum TaxID=479676 RepID=A0AAV6L8G2_9ERIC|nr:hypothetical protein RHGRI_003899 [Rhododendron griersonianum]
MTSAHMGLLTNFGVKIEFAATYDAPSSPPATHRRCTQPSPPSVVARSQPHLSRQRRLLWRCRTTRADEGEEVLIVAGEMVDVGGKAEEADGDFDFEEDDGGGKADLSRIIGFASDLSRS